MSQQLVTPELFDQVAESAFERARRMVEQLDAFAARGEDMRRESNHVLAGRAHRLAGPRDAPASALHGCTAVMLPSRVDLAHPTVMAIVGQAQWERQSEGLREHAAVLRATLVDALAAARGAHKRGLFRSRHRAATSPQAIDRLRELDHWATATGFAEDLDRFLGQGPIIRTQPSAYQIRAAAAQALGMPAPPSADPVLAPSDIRTLRLVLEGGTNLQRTRDRLVDDIKKTYEAVRDRMITRRLKELPVSVIGDVSKGNLRVGALERAGIVTVNAVLEQGSRLELLEGVGAHTAMQSLAIARNLRREIKDDLRLRIDLDEGDKLLSRLVSSLHLLLGFEARLDAHRAEIADLLAILAPFASLPATDDAVMLLHQHSPRRGGDLTRHLQERLAWVNGSGISKLLGGTEIGVPASAAWDDYKRRAVEYHGLLGELLGITVDVEAAQGHLPREVVDAVHQQDLDSSQLKVSLRGYQAFGARYSLVQRRVLIGDEMGLGKTIQALAVMAHLSSNGGDHFMVVCPSAVSVNWVKEVRKHSRLEPVRVHGAERDRSWRRWRSRGGVAITTYDTLRRLDLRDFRADLLVVDEAHYIKNPGAQRSAAVAGLVEHSERTMFLTGTPLENRVGEFQNLVAYLQPDVAQRLDGAAMVLGARKFREAVAPVYLRRNSDDVLSELPELVQTPQWVDFTSHERDAYLDALNRKAFQDMRRVGFTADPAGSGKLGRLESIVDEALANGRKVVIFSYFREVLSAVQHRLGDRVVGVITGSVSADGRQALIDSFTESPRARVLLSQIQAGGVGINLQTASVVILCEPQVKPSLEDQAVKRAHRMGQVRTVQVHRLLTPRSVDERMLEILGQKSEIFAEYAAQSDVAAASPEAVDITDSAVAKQVLAEEQARYAAELRERFGNGTSSAPAPEAPSSIEPPSPQSTVHSSHPRIAPSESGRWSSKDPDGGRTTANPFRHPSTTRSSSTDDPGRGRERQAASSTCGACGQPISLMSNRCGCS